MKIVEDIQVLMEPQPVAQEVLASSVARLNQLRDRMTAGMTPRSLPTQLRNAEILSAGVDQEHGGVVVRVGDAAQESRETRAVEQRRLLPGTATRRKGLRKPGHKSFGKRTSDNPCLKGFSNSNVFPWLLVDGLESIGE